MNTLITTQNLKNSIKNKDRVLKLKKLKTKLKIRPKIAELKILSLAEKLGNAEANLEYYTSMLNISKIEVRPHSEYLNCAKETFEAFKDDDSKFHLYNCTKNFKKYQDKVDIAIMGKTFASELVKSLTFSIDLALHSINQKIDMNTLNKVRSEAKDKTEVEFIEKLKIFKESYKDLYWN